MPAPATRIWRFFGDVFSDTSGLDLTITFNDIVIHDGEVSAEHSWDDYHNRWDAVVTLGAGPKLLCQTEIAYSITGLLPLKIKVNSDGLLNYARTTCNYTSGTNRINDPVMDFGSSCDQGIDNRRNVRIDKDIIDIAPLGWSYHITSEAEFQCDIFMDPRCSVWIPGFFAVGLRESLRTRF